MLTRTVQLRSEVPDAMLQAFPLQLVILSDMTAILFSENGSQFTFRALTASCYLSFKQKCLTTAEQPQTSC